MMEYLTNIKRLEDPQHSSIKTINDPNQAKYKEGNLTEVLFSLILSIEMDQTVQTDKILKTPA